MTYPSTHHEDGFCSTVRRRAGLLARFWLLMLFVTSPLVGCDLSQPPSAAPPVQPSPIPAAPAYPTMEPRRWLGGSDPHAAFQLPGVSFDVRVAVHPIQGWPAVAVLQRFNEGSDPIQAFVRAFNPHTGQWGAAQQVDIGESSNGMDRFGAALVGITGNDEIHAVWGASDDEGGIWTSMSADYGASWSAPHRLLSNCLAALDMAATPSGQIVILANCATAQLARAAIVIRQADGIWLPPQYVPVDAWSGAVAVAGDRQDLRITALALPFAGDNATSGRLIGKYLADPGPWQIRAVPLVPAGVADPGDLRWQPHHLSFTRLHPNGQVSTGLIFTWSDAERAHAYALISLDGGLSFGPVAPIVLDDTASGTGAQAPAVFAAPAYDPVADRLVAIWSCCRDALYGGVASTHYASWSVPGSSSWNPLLIATRIPTIIGSRSAHRIATAQAPMSRWTWVAWVEGPNEITVRSYDLNKIIPNEHYPTPTPRS